MLIRGFTCVLQGRPGTHVTSGVINGVMFARRGLFVSAALPKSCPRRLVLGVVYLKYSRPSGSLNYGIYLTSGIYLFERLWKVWIRPMTAHVKAYSGEALNLEPYLEDHGPAWDL